MTMDLTKAGFNQARAITKKWAKSFYFASGLLPRDKKLAAYSIYAICRLSDDSVDGQGNASPREKLDKIKADIELAYSGAVMKDPLLAAFQKTARDYGIPKEYFHELLSGMEIDLQKNRYADFKELSGYCYKVAGVVGLIMLRIFADKDPRPEKFAIALGIAMQLTNILRDIKEDFSRGRIYLPQEELLVHQVTEKDISAEKSDANFTALLKAQITRARDYYREAETGIRLLPGWRIRLVTCLMKNLYAAILEKIEKNGYNVFARRACVNKPEKIYLALKTILRGQYLCGST